MKEFDKFFENSKDIDKKEIHVPEYVNFISDWKDYEYPKGHCIVDKGICGCGYTEYCLTNKYPTILCSPRKLLLENKFKKHLVEGDVNVYYFKNEKESSVKFDSGLTKEEIQELSEKILNNNFGDTIDTNEKQDYLNTLKGLLKSWLDDCLKNEIYNPKILVTYDSLYHVVDVLEKNYDITQFNVVIDEFQAIWSDSAFKADVELDFVSLLKQKRDIIPNVIYLSATPMLDRYLGIMEYFKDLTFYRLIWPEDKVETILIDWKPTQSINNSCSKIIKQYKAGLFPKKVLPDKSIHESREVVFFLNSVKNICDIIRQNNLTPDECNIICAETPYNKKKLRKIGKNFTYGSIPLENEPNKMFTFCTRTAYLGADFYSDCASIVVCSNININTLSLDVSLDLPQIAGRQRNVSNVFRNQIVVFLCGKNKDESNITVEQFFEKDKEKDEDTNLILAGYNRQSKKEKIATTKMYRAAIMNGGNNINYVGIDSNTGMATYNHFARIAFIRAFEISRPQYLSETIIRRDDEGLRREFTTGKTDIDKEVLDLIESFRDEFNKDKNFIRRMRLFCELVKNYSNIYKEYYDCFLPIIPRNYINYMNLLGVDKIIASSCQESILNNLVEISVGSTAIKKEVLSKFEVGKSYSKSEIKTELNSIYDKLGINKTGKASDLYEFFDMQLSNVYNKTTGKRDKGFRILSVK